VTVAGVGLTQESVTLSLADLKRYAGAEFAAWKRLAEKEGFALVMPMGDVDILWMGVSWRTGDRSRLVQALVDAAKALTVFDARRVYLVGSGEGGHAALATAIHHGDLIAAAVACNPPLFTGQSRKGPTVFPETVDEMLAAAGARKTPILILAGTRDKELRIARHSVGGLATNRYQDSSAIPFAQTEEMAQKLKAAGFPIEIRKLDTVHYAPLPEDRIPAVWKWLRSPR